MTIIRLRRNTSVQWAALNPILLSGEQGYELDTGKQKIGDGNTRWLELDYYLPESDVVSLIDERVSDNTGGNSTSLSAHVNSLTPHPVYDNGPSLILLYENAKV